MVEYLPRTAWNARPPNGGPGSLTVSRVEGAVIHWPGTASETPITSKSAVASALLGWQNYHMAPEPEGRGWSDIAYQVAVDQVGRPWTLRGLRTQSGANGNADLNERYGAILLILIAGEQPTEAMKATVRAVIDDFRKIYPKGTAIRPHSAVRPDGTDCPGPAARAAIARGDFIPRTIPTPPPEDDMANWTEPELQRVVKEGVGDYMSGLYNLAANGTAAKNHAELEALLRAGNDKLDTLIAAINGLAVVTAVSAQGETSETYQAALKLHSPKDA